MSYSDLVAKLDFMYLTYQYDEFEKLYSEALVTRAERKQLKQRLMDKWQSEELWSRLLES